MVVEDDPAVRRVLLRMLRVLGYETLAAGSAPEALEAAAAHDGAIDLLITDVVMPQTHCDSFVGRLLETRPGLKVIYMSGYPAEVLKAHGIGADHRNFIQKPFTCEALGTRIRDVLEEDRGRGASAGPR